MDKFTDFWCFRINVLSRKVSRKYNNKCLEHGVTAPQSFVLFDLLDNEGTSIKDIAARVQLDSSAVTGVVDRLFKEGLVIRQEDPTDRRSLNVSLTPRGQVLAEELLPVAREFNLSIRSLLDADKARSFEDCLQNMEEGINSSGTSGD